VVVLLLFAVVGAVVLVEIAVVLEVRGDINDGCC
jgi:hypothetical protein